MKFSEIQGTLFLCLIFGRGPITIVVTRSSRILLPKMAYTPEERWEVILRAYQGLYELASKALFEKYLDFIDIYAEITEGEREDISQEMTEHKETAMLAQYIRNKGFEEGIHKGIQQGIHQGIQQGVQQGLLTGAEQKVKEMVLKMHRKGMSVGQIADILELPPEQVDGYVKAEDACH